MCIADKQLKVYGTFVFGHYYVAYLSTISTVDPQGGFDGALDGATGPSLLFRQVFEAMRKV